MAGGHLVEDDAEREDVGPMIDLLALHLLGRHVGDRPDDRALLGEGLGRHVVVLARVARRGELGESEVEDLHRAVLGDHDVGRLEIAVGDAALVRDGQGLDQRGGDLDRALDRQPVTGDDLVEALAVDELHRDDVADFRLLDREDGDDVGVRQRRHGLRLATEALQPLLAPGHVRPAAS